MQTYIPTSNQDTPPMPYPAPEVTAAPPILTAPEYAHALRLIGAVTIVRLVSRPIPAVAGEGRDHAQR